MAQLKNVEEKLRELFSCLREVKEAARSYHEAISKAIKMSEELGIEIESLIQQPHYSIGDYEIDN